MTNPENTENLPSAGDRETQARERYYICRNAVQWEEKRDHVRGWPEWADLTHQERERLIAQYAD